MSFLLTVWLYAFPISRTKFGVGSMRRIFG